MTHAAITRPMPSGLPTVSRRSLTRHITFLDDVRGVAILAVFIFHAAGAAYPYDRLPWDGWHRRLPVGWVEWLIVPARFGWAGVAIFFVVSGFCIHLSFQNRPEWKDFFVRRFFRIYPPYLLAVLFFAFVLPLTRLDLHDRHASVQLATHLALVHNFGNTTLGGINGAFWTIAIEVQLYALYPLLVFLADRFGWNKTIGLTAVIEIGLRLAILFYPGDAPAEDPFKEVPSFLVASPLCFWFSWSIGAYLAELYLRGAVGTLARFLPPFVLLALAVGAEMTKALTVFSFTLFSLGTAAVLARMLVDKKSRWPLPRFFSFHLAQTGLWSYSIYLLHLPLVVCVAMALRVYLPSAWNRPAIVFCLTVGSFLVIKPLSGGWYHWCELKGIALGKRVAASTSRP